MGSQPEPYEGGEEVYEHMLSKFIELSRAQYECGKIEYGTPLKTFNGRRAGVDALEELIDASMYVMQTLIELDEILDALSKTLTLVSDAQIENGFIKPEVIKVVRDFEERNTRDGT